MPERKKYELGNEYSEIFSEILNKHYPNESEETKAWRKSQLNKTIDERVKSFGDKPYSRGRIGWLPTFFLIVTLITLFTYAVCLILQ